MSLCNAEVYGLKFNIVCFWKENKEWESNDVYYDQKDRKGDPFSRLGPPSSLSGAGRIGFWQYCHSFRNHHCISRKSRQVHSSTTGALAVAYNCECLLLLSKEAADTSNANQSSPERPGRGSFLKVRAPF